MCELCNMFKQNIMFTTGKNNIIPTVIFDFDPGLDKYVQLETYNTKFGDLNEPTFTFEGDN